MHASHVTLQFFNDRRTTATRHIQKLPASTHALSMPTTRLVFAPSGNIPLGFVPDFVLNETAELVGVSTEQI